MTLMGNNMNLNSYNAAINNKKSIVYTSRNNKNKKLLKTLLRNNIIRLSIKNNQFKSSLIFTDNLPKYKKINFSTNDNKYTFK